MRRCRRVPTTAAWPCRGRGRRRPRGRGVLRHPVDRVVAGARRRPARRRSCRWCGRAATRTAHRRSPARRHARPPGALAGMGSRPGRQTAASRRAGMGRCRRAGDRRPRSVADRTAHLVDPGTSARPAMGRSRGIRPRCWAGAADTQVGCRAPNPTEVNAEASTTERHDQWANASGLRARKTLILQRQPALSPP